MAFWLEHEGCRVLGSCSVRDSSTLLSGMLLVLPESWTLLSGTLLVTPESWMSLVDMLPKQRWISSGQRGVYCEPTDGILRLRKCAVQ